MHFISSSPGVRGEEEWWVRAREGERRARPPSVILPLVDPGGGGGHDARVVEAGGHLAGLGPKGVLVGGHELCSRGARSILDGELAALGGLTLAHEWLCLVLEALLGTAADRVGVVRDEHLLAALRLGLHKAAAVHRGGLRASALLGVLGRRVRHRKDLPVLVKVAT